MKRLPKLLECALMCL